MIGSDLTTIQVTLNYLILKFSPILFIECIGNILQKVLNSQCKETRRRHSFAEGRYLLHKDNDLFEEGRDNFEKDNDLNDNRHHRKTGQCLDKSLKEK